MPDIVLEDSRLIKIGGQRQRPPKSRVRVKWLNPTLKKYLKQDQLLGQPETVTLGWFIPYWKRTVWYSEDRTQRAVPSSSTRINWGEGHSVSCNWYTEKFGLPKIMQEDWYPQAENKGKLEFVNPLFGFFLGLTALYLKSVVTRSDMVGRICPCSPRNGECWSRCGGSDRRVESRPCGNRSTGHFTYCS